MRRFDAESVTVAAFARDMCLPTAQARPVSDTTAIIAVTGRLDSFLRLAIISTLEILRSLSKVERSAVLGRIRRIALHGIASEARHAVGNVEPLGRFAFFEL